MKKEKEKEKENLISALDHLKICIWFKIKVKFILQLLQDIILPSKFSSYRRDDKQ